MRKFGIVPILLLLLLEALIINAIGGPNNTQVSYCIVAPEDVGAYEFWTWRRYLNFWYSSGSKFTAFCHNLAKMYIRAVSGYSLRTLFLRWKLIFFTFESAAPWTDNGVRDCRFNWLVAPLTLMGSTPWAPCARNLCSSDTAGIRSCNLATFSMQGNHLAYVAT